MNYFEAGSDFPNRIGILMALLKFRRNVFHPTLDLLTEKLTCIPVKPIFVLMALLCHLSRLLLSCPISGA